MSSINVNRNVADLFYRYKMPRICAKVEGKGNGIKTVLVNMPEVAKALSRPADYITKYFGCELGAQTQFDFKNERFIVNGSHDIAKLQVLLDGFIRKFVLCPDCDNPETELMVSTKRNTISQVCRACGYHGLLNFNHKLNTYILKNPPRTDPLALGSSLTEGYRSQRSKRSQTTIYRGGKKTESETLTSPELFPIRITHCRGSQTEDDESWTADISAAAVRARMQDLSVGAKTIALTEDTEKNEKKRMDLFYAFIKQRISEPTRLPEILREAERLDVKSKAPLILFELLIRPAHIAADIRTHRALLLSFTLSDTRAQRSALYALDAMCADKKSLITKIPALLKLLYDEDIVEENSIVEWAAKPSRKFAPRDVSTEVRQKAEPFLKWLSEADEEDSDVTEDGSGADFDNGSRKRVVATKTPSTKENVNKDESDVELDIDAI